MMPSLTLASLAPLFDTVLSQMSCTILPMPMLCSYFVRHFIKVLPGRIERKLYSMQVTVLSGLLFLPWWFASSRAEPYYFKASIWSSNLNQDSPTL